MNYEWLIMNCFYNQLMNSGIIKEAFYNYN